MQQPDKTVNESRQSAIKDALLRCYKQCVENDADQIRGVTDQPSLPIDVEHLAAINGLRIIRVRGLAGSRTRNQSGEPLSGLFDFVRGRIYVEERNHPARQRFTIAHELGHYLLGHRELLGDVHADAKIAYGGDSAQVFSDQLRQVEHEANQFAGELLIPRKQLDQLVSQFGPDVIMLAKHFDVSVPAMRVHLSPYLHPALGRSRFG